MNGIIPSLPLHMRKCTEMCPLKRGKKTDSLFKLGLCPVWTENHSAGDGSFRGLWLTQPLQWLFTATYNQVPAGSLWKLQLRTLGNTYEVPNAHSQPPPDLNSAYVLCREIGKTLKNGHPSHQLFASSFYKSSKRDKPFGNCSGVVVRGGEGQAAGVSHLHSLRPWMAAGGEDLRLHGR